MRNEKKHLAVKKIQHFKIKPKWQKHFYSNSDTFALIYDLGPC